MLTFSQIEALGVSPSSPPETLVDRFLGAYLEAGFYPVSGKDFVKNLRDYTGLDPLPRAFGAAFDRKMTNVKGRRGFYVLREDSQNLPSGEGFVAKPPKPRSSNPEGVAWAPCSVAESSARKESWYAEDEGLRSLAATQVKCFKNWSDEDAACGGCPLARWCREATLARIEELARAMDADEEAAPAPAPSPVPAPSPAPSLISAFVSNSAPAPSPAPSPNPDPSLISAISAPSPAPAPNPAPASPNAEESVRILGARGVNAAAIPMPFRGVCSGCGEDVAAETMVVHIRGKGLHHPNCALA